MDIKTFIEEYDLTQIQLATLIDRGPSLVSQQKKAGFQIFIEGDSFAVVNPDNIHRMPGAK